MNTTIAPRAAPLMTVLKMYFAFIIILIDGLKNDLCLRKYHFIILNPLDLRNIVLITELNLV